MIQLTGVTVAVPVLNADGTEHTRTLLHDLDLSLTEPRIALIGANGSGKSTLLRLLNGLLTPSAGQVLVDGLDTRRRARQVRQRVGFVFTDPLSQLVMSTPLEDVELSLRRLITDRRARRARAMELLDARGLGHLAHQSIYDLSGGERQLVALTTVLAVEPRVVVADEPTTLLDLRNREAMRRAFAALPQQVIYSTHDLEVARDADRVLVIDDGRVVFDGHPEPAITHYRGRMT
ncbi:MAG: ABC transporter ATP-binding protein [Propionibacterium sp.]|nr:ABC transporter ATP-binding protein [Propionibacterium sp.]